MNVKMSYRTGIVVGLALQSTSRACRKLFGKNGLPLMSNAFALYMLFDRAKVRYFVPLQRELCYSPLLQEQSPRSLRALLKGWTVFRGGFQLVPH